MEIKVLGTGCTKCRKLKKLVEEVVQELGIAASVEHVTDIKEIAKAGVILTPGLVIDGTVKLSGKVPSKAELTTIITTAMTN